MKCSGEFRSGKLRLSEVFKLGWSGNAWTGTGPQGLNGAVPVRPLPRAPRPLGYIIPPNCHQHSPPQIRSRLWSIQEKLFGNNAVHSRLAQVKARFAKVCQENRPRQETRGLVYQRGMGLKRNSPWPAHLSSFPNSSKPVGPAGSLRRQGSGGPWTGVTWQDGTRPHWPAPSLAGLREGLLGTGLCIRKAGSFGMIGVPEGRSRASHCLWWQTLRLPSREGSRWSPLRNQKASLSIFTCGLQGTSEPFLSFRRVIALQRNGCHFNPL